MRVHDFPAVRALAHEPRGVTVEHVVVALEGLWVGVASGRQRLTGERQRIEHRRRDMNDPHALVRGTFAEAADAVLERLRALVAERIIDAVVHPITGEY